MELAYALHQIIRGKQAIEPGTVFPVETEAELRDLLKLEAIRRPTKDEISLYKMSLGDEVEAVAVEDPASDQRANLVERANAAGVTFKANISDEKLMERVVEAEAKKAQDEAGVTEPPSNVLV